MESEILGLCLSSSTSQLHDLEQVTHFLQALIFLKNKSQENNVSTTTSQVVWLQLDSECESICKFLSCTNIKCYYEINKATLLKKKVNQFLKSPGNGLPPHQQD